MFFSFKSCVSQLSVDQIRRNLVYFELDLSPPKIFQNLSTDSQENATCSLKVTNPHASIPSSVHKQDRFLYLLPFQIDKAFEVFESNGLIFDDWYPIAHFDDCVYDRSPSCKDNWE